MAPGSVHVLDIAGGVDVANDLVQLEDGQQYVVQRIKIGYGDSGAYLDVATHNPLPVGSAGDEERALLYPLRALQYARDAADRMRVSVDTGTITVGGVQFGTSNTVPTWFGTGAASSMDLREAERTQSQIKFMQQRSRWTLT